MSGVIFGHSYLIFGTGSLTKPGTYPFGQNYVQQVPESESF